MPLSQKIIDDLKQAMLAKDAPRTSALRMLKSAVMNAEIGKKGAALSDADVQTVIQKQINQRKESLEQYTKGGRPELAAVEAAEIKLLESYLPAQMSEAELEKLLRDIVTKNGVTAKKDFGKAMKIAQDELQGRADNKRISAVLNKVLA